MDFNRKFSCHSRRMKSAIPELNLENERIDGNTHGGLKGDPHWCQTSSTPGPCPLWAQAVLALGGLAFLVFLSPKVPTGQPIYPDLDHFQHPQVCIVSGCIVIRELERQRRSVAPCCTNGLRSYILLPLLSSKLSWRRQSPLSIKRRQDKNLITQHHAAVLRRYSIIHTPCLGLGKIVRLIRYVTTHCFTAYCLLLVPFSMRATLVACLVLQGDRKER